jgi:PAS domain S-box-containing protein
LGATLLNVIEGGKKKRSLSPQRNVNVTSLLEALPQAVFLLDVPGRIVALNGSTERLIGRPRNELLGHSVALLLQERLESPEEFAILLRRAVHGEVVRSGQMIFHCLSGDAMRVIVSASPVCDQTGQIGGFLLCLQDVTELAALQKHSDSNERHVAVGQMTAGLVHDFNNVLNTITEAVAVLDNDRQRSERDRTVLGIIANAVHYGAETIRNTRKYLVGSREKPSLVNVRKLLEEVLELTHPVLQTHTGVTVVRETQDCGQVKASADDLRRAAPRLTNVWLSACATQALVSPWKNRGKSFLPITRRRLKERGWAWPELAERFKLKVGKFVLKVRPELARRFTLRCLPLQTLRSRSRAQLRCQAEA